MINLKRTLTFSLLGASLALTGCVSESHTAAEPISAAAVVNKPAKVLDGVMGMVVAAQPEATNAANRILAAGGNAADAAVAAGFAISVVEPTMNSIGGRSQVLVRTAEGEYFAINGMTEIPAGYERPEVPDKDGYRVIATPGVVAALARIHSEHGSMPWADLVQPAIEIAENGFEMLPGEAIRQSMGLAAIKTNPGFLANVLVEGKTRKAGELFRQPKLASTLKTIAEDGAESFYRGEIAAQIAADMQANGGFVTAQDLSEYKALDGRYISTPYRGYEIHSIAAPAGGGLVVKALNILENFKLAEMNDLQWAGVVNQALAISIRTMGDDYEETDLSQVTSKDWAKTAAAEVVVPAISVANLDSTMTAEDSLSLAMVDHSSASFDWAGDSWGEDSHHTTHFVAADCAGMTVSITQTIGPLFGSKVITPELGFPYASTMGSYLATAAQSPGSRPRTTIAPTIVTKDGEVVMVLGAAGGLRILSGIVQTISRFVDQGLSLEAAVAAPRIHPSTSTDVASGTRTVEPMIFHAELTARNGWAESDVTQWQAAGFEVKPNNRNAAFARVHALAKQEGFWRGAADLDWEGSAAAPTITKCSIR